MSENFYKLCRENTKHHVESVPKFAKTTKRKRWRNIFLETGGTSLVLSRFHCQSIEGVAWCPRTHKHEKWSLLGKGHIGRKGIVRRVFQGQRVLLILG